MHDDLLGRVFGLPEAERDAVLREESRFDADGIEALLDAVEEEMRSDPRRAGQFAALCADLGRRAGAPLTIPRAHYLQAQALALASEFGRAMALLEVARDEFAALGALGRALRTNLGRMHLLAEMGHVEEALEVGGAVLDSVAAAEAGGDALPEADLLAGLVHQNRGACLEHVGRYSEAIDAYAAAEERFRALDIRPRLGDVIHDRGLALLGLGRAREAELAFSDAAAIRAADGQRILEAQSLSNLGTARLMTGQYTASLAAYEAARRAFEALDALDDQHLLLLDTAEAYLALNLIPEALASYREADRRMPADELPHRRAAIAWGTGAAFLADGRLAAAGEALDDAARRYAESGNVPLQSSVLVERAAVHAALGEGPAALDTARRALSLVEGGRWPVQLCYAHLRLADLALPDAEAAEIHLAAAAAAAAADALALPQLRYRLSARLGHVRRLQGRNMEAAEMLGAAVDELERLRGMVAQEAVRASFFRDKTAVFDDLVELGLGRADPGGVAAAFDAAEQARARSLGDLVSGFSRPAAPAGDSGLEARIADLLADLGAAHSALLSADTAAGNRSDLQARAIELEQEISRLRLGRSAAAADADPFGTPLDLGEVRQHLSADTILLAYHVSGDAIHAFVVGRDDARAVPRIAERATVTALLERLAVAWGRLRTGSAFAEVHGAVLERSATRLLRALDAALLEPLRPVLDEFAMPGSRPGRLVIVPHGFLHGVPFQALFDGETYLADRHEISYAPSATLHVRCEGRPLPGVGPALVMGVPDPGIPAVAAEVAAVSRHLDRPVVRLGADATRAAFAAEAPGAPLIHLASHGLYRADNPMFSGLKLADGWLMAGDVLDLRLEGATVVLSACETARSGAMAGDEMLGLVRAFIGAGAGTLIASQWPVPDETSALLSASWYAEVQRGRSHVAALRRAQMAVRAERPHPYHWAPFILIGRGGDEPSGSDVRRSHGPNRQPAGESR